MKKCFYVPWLHMHQPLIWQERNGREVLISNLEKMLTSSDQKENWDGKLIVRAYKNPAKYVYQLSKDGYDPKVMVDFSGILLESLHKMRKLLKTLKVENETIGDIISLYKKVLKKYPNNLEFAGTAYSHSYFPTTPKEDWELQIIEWKKVFKKLFGQKSLKRVKGFWFPEMGIPGERNGLKDLIRILRENGYEWVFLPPEAIEGFKSLSFEKQIDMCTKPHKLVVGKEEITAFIKVPYYFIDQQAGCDAKCVLSKCKEALRIVKDERPLIVVPASDGENGNVMMNQFFPETFEPFFKSNYKNVSSKTLSEFLEDSPDKKMDCIKIKDVGGSWVGGHQLWLEGGRRQQINKKIKRLSIMFHNVEQNVSKSKRNKILKYLLIAETSCYTYWNSPFWFEQAEKTIEMVENLLKNND
ncbi:MAG: glycoside hydrolase [Candidatus Aenigmarchaeota archaeon]|nr:glycoside hydrolase [Candidatus Aenigmarchaeota archaeon]